MNDTARIDQAETVPMPSDHGPIPPSAEPPGPGVPPGSGVPQGPGVPPGSGGPQWPSLPPASPVGAGSFYRQAWRRVPRDLGYMALTAVLLCTVYFAFPLFFLHTLSGSGLGALFNPFSVVMFFVALFVARWLGAFEKLRIGWTERRPIRPVDWTPRWQQNWFMRILSAVANPHYWLALLHTVVVYPAAAFVTVGAGALLLTGFVAPVVLAVVTLLHGWEINAALARDGGMAQPWPWVLGGVLGAVSMAAAVLLFPLWTRGAALAHYWIDNGLLGGFQAEVLQQRVVGLQQSRAGAVTAEGQALRQIERDLHDGPQQRLVRLRMDLAAAERAMTKDPTRAAELMAEASGHAQDALDELRALSRGFAPPILLDRGLVAALEALASRTPIPVGLDIRLPEGVALPTEVERNVYFTVSELLTNTTKHAGATTAGVSIAIVQDASGGNVLVIGVTDDGRGGATVREGHGIQGLMGRMRALDGDLTVSSPDGGPTEATARIPLGALNGVPTGGPTGGAGAGPVVDDGRGPGVAR